MNIFTSLICTFPNKHLLYPTATLVTTEPSLIQMYTNVTEACLDLPLGAAFQRLNMEEKCKKIYTRINRKSKPIPGFNKHFTKKEIQEITM